MKKPFPVEDGHIESLIIGVSQVKVSFHTWHGQALVLLYENVKEIQARQCVGPDMGRCTEMSLPDGLRLYRFESAWGGGAFLDILAGSCIVYETGSAGDFNNVLYKIGFDYLGGQSQNFD